MNQVLDAANVLDRKDVSEVKLAIVVYSSDIGGEIVSLSCIEGLIRFG